MLLIYEWVSDKDLQQCCLLDYHILLKTSSFQRTPHEKYPACSDTETVDRMCGAQRCVWMSCVCVYAQKHVSHTPQTITSEFLNECKNDTAKTCNMQLPLPLRIHTHTHTHTQFFFSWASVSCSFNCIWPLQ